MNQTEHRVLTPRIGSRFEARVAPRLWELQPFRSSLLGLCSIFVLAVGLAKPLQAEELPRNLRIVIEATQPTENSRNGRLPLFVLPISGTLKGVAEQPTRDALEQLNRRAIGYSVEWNPNEFDASIEEGLRIAKIQRILDQPVAVNGQ